MSDHVTTACADGVLTLSLNRPDKKNAITAAMYDALAEALEAAQDDPEVRVILIRGEGSAFSAGNDIGDFMAVARDGLPVQVIRFLRALSDSAKPLVAAVQGLAVGIGATMLLHCDYVLLADDARLTTPFVNLGLVPEAASSLLLPARIGYVRAFAMIALGEAVEARDAVAWGLANRVVPAAQLSQAANSIAARLAEQPQAALIATKALMRPRASIDARFIAEESEFAARLQSPEAQEAFKAFAERRPPNFRGL